MNKIAPNRGLSLSDMQRLFDETAEGNMERRQAIADCMGHSFSQAKQRIHEADNDLHSRTLARDVCDLPS